MGEAWGLRMRIFNRIRSTVFALAALAGAPACAELIYESDRTDDGYSYIGVIGLFHPNDDLSEFVRLTRRHQPEFVAFQSGGGNIYKAMELGRLIRAQGLNTLQVRSLECSSACALAFMGGVGRFAEPGAIGVHKSTFSSRANLSVEDAVSAVQATTADIIAYMQEMGIDPAVLKLALATDADDMRYLSGSEMEQYGIRRELDRRTERVAVAPPLATRPDPVRTTRPDPVRTTRARPVTPAADHLFSPGVTRRTVPDVSEQPQEYASTAPAATPRDLIIPVARTGWVRHPKGMAAMKASANAKDRDLAIFRNGTWVEILDSADRWYRVRTATRIGYMHHTWLKIDQYDATPGLNRLVQIKSFQSYAKAIDYVDSLKFQASIYLASNGWYAITLPDSYAREKAVEMAKLLKRKRLIPDDSFVTLGNTYMRRICCS